MTIQRLLQFSTLALLYFGMKAAVSQQLPLTPVEFAQMAAERMHKELPNVDFKVVGHLELDGKDASGKSIGNMYLDRVFSFCLRNASNCDAGLSQYAKGIAETVKERNRPVTQAMLRIAIRPEEYLEQLRKQPGFGNQKIYTRPVAPGLVAIPVVDFTRTTRFVIDKDLEELGVDEENLFKIAAQNLRDTTKPLTAVSLTPSANSLGQIRDEEYASSRLFFHSDWKNLAASMHNQLIVIAPTPNALLYGDGSLPGTADALRTLGGRVASSSTKPLSMQLLRWTDDGWEIYKR
ncbi:MULTISPECIES: hypothetical protein [unclassified Herbaspirillum]|uniref:hypothetical protein n=1 Tax=unclassified Herbaspirillum TaxID=2624150 RepID=UPI00383AB709